MEALTIHYGNLTRSEFLDEEIQKQYKVLNGVLPEKFKAEVWLSAEGSSEGAKNPKYLTQLRVNQTNHSIFIKKSRSNFFNSISETFNAAKKALKRRKEKLNDFKKSTIKKEKYAHIPQVAYWD